MNLYFGNHQSFYIHLRNDRALWALWFESAENAAGGMALGKVSTGPQGNPSPMALNTPAKCLIEPVHQQHAAPKCGALAAPASASSWKAPISDIGL